MRRTSGYRTPLYYMLYACCIASERGMIWTERWWILWSSVMLVNCIRICAVESFGQSCEKNKNGAHFRAVWKNTPYSGRVLYFSYCTQMNTVCITDICIQMNLTKTITKISD